MKKILVLTWMVAALAAVGCGDDDSGNRCEGVPETDLCETAGELQCSTDGTTVQSCAADANGCLVWSSTTTCGVNQACVATGDAPVCECVDECAAGEAECRGSVVWACEADADGCLAWEAGDDCADSDEACVESGTTASCETGCVSDCGGAGESHCIGDVIEICTDVGGGCLQWQDGDDCTETSEVCDDSSGSAVCVAGCTPDCDTADATQCNADAIETCTDVGDGCLQWQETTDCTETSQVCDDTSGTPTCVTPCVSDCTTADATQCDGTVIETCTDVGDGCLQWVGGDDCATTADYCDATSGTATCMTCTDTCTDGATQCNGTVIETCTADAHGCFVVWAAGTDCATTSQECDATTGTATCVDPVGAGSCADPIVVRVDHYALAGTDFTADFADDQTFSDASCDSSTGTAEAVFSIALTAGETVMLRELGTLDAVLSLQNSCGDASVCVFSEDFGEVTGHDYTATADETVFLVVEAYYATPTNRAYDIRIDIVSAEDCGNGIDDDVDGDVDCDDSDCFGDTTDCTTETNCTDSEDNDGDGNTDCDDSDCGAVPACASYRAVFEAFAWPDDPFDLDGAVLTFTPSTTDPMGYTWAVTAGTGDWDVAPGTGTATGALTLTDDSRSEYVFAHLASFPFYGTDYTRMFVGSNGYLTFAAGLSGVVDTASEFFAQPIIAALAEDLNPGATAAGDVTVDEFADRVAVTYDNIPFYAETVYNRFQIVLFADGRIQIQWLAVPIGGFDSGDTPYVGIASGTGRTPYPDETNFLTLAAEADCTDTLDNDLDGLVDCNDGDCYGVGSCGYPVVKINEVAYDDADTDDAEFVELFAPGGRVDLTRFALVHINGGGGAVIWTAVLTGERTNSAGFFTVGSAAVPGATAPWSRFITVPAAGALQNDGESLVLYSGWDGTTGTVVDTLEYESDGAGPGEGTFAPALTGAWNSSIGRYPDGTDTDVNGTDFVVGWWTTPNAPNTPAQPAGFRRVSASSSASSGLPAAIPDNNTTGIALTLDSGSFLGTSVADIHVGVRIRHTYRGDLIVTVSSPTTTTVRLHNRTGGGTDDLMTVYDLATTPDQELTPFVGENPTGTWTLNVSDHTSLDTGSVLEWVVWVQNP